LRLIGNQVFSSSDAAQIIVPAAEQNLAQASTL
jgi:hypothetical protein